MTAGDRVILVSIVSHGHGEMVLALLHDLGRTADAARIRVVLTLNVDEPLPGLTGEWPFPLEILRNRRPLGFSENHNQAFRRGEHAGPVAYFCVLNPDLRIADGVVGQLCACLEAHPDAGLAAPSVMAPSGAEEPSLRALPSLGELIGKAVARLLRRPYRHRPPDGRWFWAAGMCMLFRGEDFGRLGGFDERFHLYYEDVDICCRLALSGRVIVHCPSARVTHQARRDSHRKLRFFLWHLASAARFFSSPTYFRCRRWLSRSS